MPESIRTRIKGMPAEHAIEFLVTCCDNLMRSQHAIPWQYCDLTRTESRFLGCLVAAKGDMVMYDALHAAMYFDAPRKKLQGAGSLRTIAHRIKKKYPRIRIENFHGRGYRYVGN